MTDRDDEVKYAYPDTEPIPAKRAPTKPFRLVFRSVLQPGTRWVFEHDKATAHVTPR